MPNDTSCSPTSNCTILGGAITNGTLYVASFNPNAPAPLWHQRMELATICVCNSLTLILIVARIAYRWFKLRRFRGDDRWMAIAGVILVGYTVSQIGTNKYGSGLWMRNVPKSWRPMHWHYLVGWSGYYMVVSCIKLSVCFCFLQILGLHQKDLKYWVYGLCTIITCLGITMTGSWLFNCTPFKSNFDWNVLSESCINYDIFRWLWIGTSIPIDIAIMAVPLTILTRTKLRTHERRILKLVFSATLLGTVTCLIGIYGAYQTRTQQQNELFYHETSFVMMNDIEILMYALGASFPVLSRYMIQIADPGPGQTHSNFSSWARYIPDFFTTSAAHVQSRLSRRTNVVESQIVHHTTTVTMEHVVDVEIGSDETVTPCKSDGSQTSTEGGSDLEKATSGSAKIEVGVRETWE